MSHLKWICFSSWKIIVLHDLVFIQDLIDDPTYEELTNFVSQLPETNVDGSELGDAQCQNHESNSDRCLQVVEDNLEQQCSFEKRVRKL